MLDVGGREVVLRFLGRGHTDHDLVVEVEDGSDGTVVFAGDLVEEGAPPAFEDAFPADWPATLGRVHALARGPVVPGHGAVVDAAFVGAQREELLAVLAAVRADGSGTRRRTTAPSSSPGTWWSRARPGVRGRAPGRVAGDVGRLHALARGPVVPGHGDVVDADFVGAQREELLAVLAAVRSGRPEDGPYDAATMRIAASRPAEDSASGEAADHRERQHAEQAGDRRATATAGRSARTGSLSIAAVSASTPVSRSTVNGPRRPTLMSVAM